MRAVDESTVWALNGAIPCLLCCLFLGAGVWWGIYSDSAAKCSAVELLLYAGSADGTPSEMCRFPLVVSVLSDTGGRWEQITTALLDAAL